MNPTEQTFLNEVLANPKDDAPRLLYADYLMEQDNPRGEFIQVQCAFASIACPLETKHIRRDGCLLCSKEEIQEHRRVLRNREQELLQKDYPPLLGHRSRLCDGVWTYQPYGWSGVWGYAFDWCTYQRGFVEQVECNAVDWFKYAEEALQEAPINRVRLTTLPHVFVIGESVGNGASSLEPLRAKFGGSVMLHTIPHKRIKEQTWEQMQWELIPQWLHEEWPAITFDLEPNPIMGYSKMLKR